MRKIDSIVIIAAVDFPHGTSSANLLRTLGMGFLKLEKKVHYILTRGNLYPNPRGLSNRTNEYQGLSFTYSSFIKRPNIYLLKVLEVLISVFSTPWILFLKKISGKADAVILYTGYAYQNLPVTLTCKILMIPVFKYSVDWYNKEAIIRKWWQAPKWWMFIAEISFFDRLLNGVIIVSHLLYNHYLKIGIPATKLILIPSVLDLSMFTSGEPALKKDGNHLRIGYCGAAPLLNGVDDLIRAFRLVREEYNNAELLIVGDVTGEGTQVPMLKKIARENGVEAMTSFTGRVPGPAVPGYLASCDILVLARKNTQFAQAGFPTKLGEYFAAGKPVVMTDVGDITIYFDDKIQLTIAKPDDPVSVASSIQFLLENPKEAEKIAERGYHWAKENLDYTKTSEKIYHFMTVN